MTTRFAAILPLLLLVGATPPQLHQPTGRWVVDFHDSQCVATRTYGTPEKPFTLVIKTPPLGDVVQLGLTRPATGGQAVQLHAQLVVDDQPPIKTTLFAFTGKTQNQRAFLINLPTAKFAPVRTASTLAIRAAGEFNERFAMSQTAALMRVMDDCVADLRKVWNVEEDVAEPTLRKRAEGTLQGLIKSTDYPQGALDRNQTGTVMMVLLVNEAGRVADCTVIGTSGAASLDAQSCGIVKQRARFKPAQGPDGKPAKDSFVQRISWKIF